jgi:hypothetical protein
MRGNSFELRKGILVRKVFPLFWLLCLVAGAAFFTACDNNGDGLIPGLPVGTWVSTYQEEYLITTNEFTSSYDGLVGYKGDIINVREDGAGAGYITIKYTENAWNAAALDNYYVIHWKNRMETSVDLSGASGGTGKPTQAEAEAEYTIDNAEGYFATYSTCAKQ